MNRSKKLIVTIFITGVSFAVNYLINFFLTPYVTNNIGTEAYGYVSLAKNFASYAMIITTALNSYASRFIAVSYHNKDYKKSNVYFTSVFIADAVLGGVILCIAALFAANIDYFFEISPNLIHDVKILFIYVFINLFINTSSTALQAAAYIKNKLNIVGAVKGAAYCTEALTLLACFTLWEPHVYYVGIGLIAATFVQVFANFIITKRYTPELKIDVQIFSIAAVKELVLDGIWNSFNSLGNTLNSGLDLIISNLMLSSVAMGQISIVKTVYAIFSGVYQLIAQPFQPLFLKDYSDGNYESLLKNLKLSMKISGWLSNVIFCGFTVLGIQYYELWLPSQDTLLLYNLTMLATVSCVFEGPMYPLYYIYTLTVKNKIPCIITIIGGVLNVAGMVALIRFTSLGIYAVQLTTAFVMIFINSVTNPIYMSKCLKVKVTTFYPAIIRNLLSCFVMLIVFVLIENFFSVHSWVQLVVAAVVLSVIGSVIHFLVVLNKEEWRKIAHLFRK